MCMCMQNFSLRAYESSGCGHMTYLYICDTVCVYSMWGSTQVSACVLSVIYVSVFLLAQTALWVFFLLYIYCIYSVEFFLPRGEMGWKGPTCMHPLSLSICWLLA